ncbi:MAG TPA: alkaline phosphatase family protein [Chthonomonadaceae bacterium]|nr:alkaline phosphatase family protein [Chthonomonadaceae bacterium]
MIGLDCAAPELVFDRWRDRLPNLRRIMERGVYGPLESTVPPITVPAWICMMTGKDPGTLGIYGFRNRRDRSYEGLAFASSKLVREPALWDVLAEHGKQSIVLGVPLTYPPRPISGLLVSDFLAPDTNSDYTYPSELKEEIRQVVGEYLLDTREFRTEDKARLLADIYTMTERRFALARHLLTTKPWDFFIMVEMGPDRIHHAFWKYMDPKHRRYVAGNPFENAIRDYYIALDRQIGDLLDLLEPDTRVLVVSDHGAKRMDGGLCFNEWLIREGYLTLKQRPEGFAPFSPDMVDWSRTRAWGDGGYYGRLYLNVRGREPQGVVAPEEVEALKAELIAKLEALEDDEGRPLGTKVFRPERLYAAVRNIPPDLIVYFGDLHWRSVGSVGHPSIWTHENDIGPDDANHAQLGLFLMVEARDLKATSEPASEAQEANRRDSRAMNDLSGDPADNRPADGKAFPPVGTSDFHVDSMALEAHRREGLSLYDVAPTVLHAFGITPPPGMGRAVIGTPTVAPSDSAYTEEEEAELARRLEDLGYL